MEEHDRSLITEFFSSTYRITPAHRKEQAVKTFIKVLQTKAEERQKSAEIIRAAWITCSVQQRIDLMDELIKDDDLNMETNAHLLHYVKTKIATPLLQERFTEIIKCESAIVLRSSFVITLLYAASKVELSAEGGHIFIQLLETVCNIKKRRWLFKDYFEEIKIDCPMQIIWYLIKRLTQEVWPQHCGPIRFPINERWLDWKSKLLPTSPAQELDLLSYSLQPTLPLEIALNAILLDNENSDKAAKVWESAEEALNLLDRQTILKSLTDSFQLAGPPPTPGSVEREFTPQYKNEIAEYEQLLQQRRSQEATTGIATKQLPNAKEFALLFTPAILLEAEHQRQKIGLFERADDSEDDRPELFPKFLWRFVLDSQRPLIKKKWAVFTKERLDQLIWIAESISISTENDERAWQHHFVRALYFSFLESHGHPNPDKPGVIKDKMCTIVLTDNIPVVARTRKNSILERACIHARTSLMRLWGQLEPANSPYSSCFLLVPYMDRINEFLTKYPEEVMMHLYDPKNWEVVAKLYRLTADFREINAKMVMDRYPIPRLEELVDRVAGERSGRYTMGDLPDAFHTVALDPVSRPYTAVIAADQHLQYTVTPQGSSTSAPFWARIIHEIFHDLKLRKLVVYQDDLANFEGDFWKHLQLQVDIFQRLAEYNMILSWTKSKANFTTMRILGHIVDKTGKRPDPTLINAITMFDRPRNLTDVQMLIGLAEQANKYIPQLAAILEPIRELTRKGSDPVAGWLAPQEEALVLIKRILTEKPYLMSMDLMKKFRIHCDACRNGKGIGAILLQMDDSEDWRPVAYYSRTLQEAERKASATMLETIALHDAILHWRAYVQNGLEFDVITDHFALVYMVCRPGSNANNNIRLSRYINDLQEYRFNITHRSGKAHVDADAVSRLLQADDVVVINTAEDLSDNFRPLDEHEQNFLYQRFPKDTPLLIDAINEFRVKRNLTKLESLEVTIMDDSSLNIQNEPIIIKIAPIRIGTSVITIPHANRDFRGLVRNIRNQSVTPTCQSFKQWCKESPTHQLILAGDNEAFFHQVEAILAILTTKRHRNFVRSTSTNDLIDIVHNRAYFRYYKAINEELLRRRCDLKENFGAQEEMRQSVESMGNKRLYLETNDKICMSFFNAIARQLYGPQGSGQRVRRCITNYLTSESTYFQSQMIRSSETWPLFLGRIGETSVLNHHLLVAAVEEVYGIPCMILDWHEVDHCITPPEFRITDSDKQMHSIRRDSVYTKQEHPFHLYELPVNRRRQASIATDEKSEFTRDTSSVPNIRPFTILRTSHHYHSIMDLSDNLLPRSLPSHQVFIQQMRVKQNKGLISIRAKRIQQVEEGTSEVTTLSGVVRTVSAHNTRQKTRILSEASQQEKIAELKLINDLIELDKLDEDDEKQMDTPHIATPARVVLTENEAIAAVEMVAQAAGTKKKGARRPKVDKVRRQAEYKEKFDHRLPDFDDLVKELYEDPEDGALCEIMTVYHNVKDGFFYSAARVKDEQENLLLNMNDLRQHRVLSSEGSLSKGTLELTRQYNQALNQSYQTSSWPQTAEEWITEQKKDPILSLQWQLLQDGGRIRRKEQDVTEDHLPEQKYHRNDWFISCPLLPSGKRGALTRSCTRMKTLRHSKYFHTVEVEDKLLILPQHLIQQCIQLHHTSLGHPGRARTKAAIGESFYWSTMTEDITKYVRDCRYCGKRKTTHLNANIPLQSHPQSIRPFHRIHVDLLGPFNRTAAGNVLILVLKDSLTKWVELYAIPDKSADTIAKVMMEDIFLRHGPPVVLFTDNGTEFINDTLQQVIELLNIKHTKCVPANPQSNGLVENHNKTLLNQLQSFVEARLTDWDKYLGVCRYSYNTEVNPNTGISPYSMLYGREAPNATEEFIGASHLTDFNDYVENMRDSQELWWAEGSNRNVAQVDEVFNAVPLRRQSFRPYQAGDFFYHKTIPRRFYRSTKHETWVKISRKLQFKYTGPFPIVEVKSPVLYVALIHGVRKMVHAINMKPY